MERIRFLESFQKENNEYTAGCRVEVLAFSKVGENNAQNNKQNDEIYSKKRLGRKVAKMDFDEYQEKVLRTAKTDDDPKDRIINFSLGLVGEAGETVDVVKKHLYHGHLDPDKLKEELGDVLWYVAALAAQYRINLDEIARYNVDVKLRERYPDKFDPERSENR